MLTMLQAVQLAIRFTWMIQLTDIYTALNKLSRLKTNLAMTYALEDLFSETLAVLSL